MTDQAGDAVKIKLVSWRMSVRLRPNMYFGKQRTDPGLPGAVLEPSQRHGTRLVAQLDDDYFPTAAGLPTDPAGLLAKLLDDPGPFFGEPGSHPGRAWK